MQVSVISPIYPTMEKELKQRIRKALKAGKVAGISGVKNRYTIKKPKQGIKGIRVRGLKGEMKIAGPKLSVKENYSYQKTNKGIFVSIKKGSGGIISQSFVNPKTAMLNQRVGKNRYPIRKIMSLSMAQMYGNEEVEKKIEVAMIDTMVSE